jgi:hypothetical protein
MTDVVADLLDVVGPLGHEDRRRSPGDPGVRRDPPRVPAHDLEDDHAVVRLGGRVEPVDRVGADLHRGVEPEREVGRVEVVVDRLRDPDDAEPVLGELARDPEGVLPTDRDERIEVLLGERRLDPLRATVDLVEVGA